MKTILITLIALSLSGCVIHFQNQKMLTGKGSDINTPYGKISNVGAKYTSTMDFWFPWDWKSDKRKDEK